MGDYKERLIEREANRPGMRGKINAKCIECIYDGQSNGSWRKQVEKCTAKHCPLHSVRPKSSVTETEK